MPDARTVLDNEGASLWTRGQEMSTTFSVAPIFMRAVGPGATRQE